MDYHIVASVQNILFYIIFHHWSYLNTSAHTMWLGNTFPIQYREIVYQVHKNCHVTQSAVGMFGHRIVLDINFSYYFPFNPLKHFSSQSDSFLSWNILFTFILGVISIKERIMIILKESFKSSCVFLMTHKHLRMNLEKY